MKGVSCTAARAMDPREVESPPAATTKTAEKKRKLNRPITSCTRCRKNKTKCDAQSGSRSCRRCSSLLLDCELPPPAEAVESSQAIHFQEDLSERLSGIERSIVRLMSLVQDVLDNRSHAQQVETPITQSVKRAQNRVKDVGFVTSQPTEGVTRPVLLVRNLQRQFFGPKQDFSDEELAVGSVVSAGIISILMAQSLLRIFIKHYGTWISVETMDDMPYEAENTHPLLFSTAYLIAARHVPRVSKSTIQDMYMMVRRLVSSVVFKTPPLNYESLQAMALLSMFTPTIQTAMPIDSWMVSAIGMSHASLAFDLTTSYSPNSQEFELQLKQLRIWCALCLTNIQFSIGNGRPSAVQPRFVDQCLRIVDYPDARCTDAQLLVEVLLYTKTESILSEGPHNHFRPLDRLGYPTLSSVRSKWDHLFQLPECLSLTVGYWYCHLLLYRASLRDTKVDMPSASEALLNTCTNILETFLEQEFSIILNMPDHFFFMIIYAALTLCKFYIRHPLIASTQHRLMDLSPNDEHIAYRFGTVLSEIKQKAAAAGADMTPPDNGQQIDNPHAANPLVYNDLLISDDYRWPFLPWANVSDGQFNAAARNALTRSDETGWTGFSEDVMPDISDTVV